MISQHIRALILIVTLPVLVVSCGTSKRIRGVPRNLPPINLYGTTQTPPHSMDQKDYPFDADGDYMVAWASQGRAPASSTDIEAWSRSHGASSRRASPARKVSSSSSKKKTASSKSRGSSSYTIKSGDTLGAIAARNGTTVSKIKAANGMSSDMIRAGKTLKIPK